jgi:endonuclease YncB( thermonuclease family)
MIVTAFVLLLVANGANSESVSVTKVLNGGNIVVRNSSGADAYVRILGVACPNNKRSAGGPDICARAKDMAKCRKKFEPGERAAAFATEKLLNKTITLECVDHCEQARMQTRYVKLEGGIDYSLLAINQGVCDAAKFHPPHARERAYIVARNKAKKNMVGIHKVEK